MVKIRSQKNKWPPVNEKEFDGKSKKITVTPQIENDSQRNKNENSNESLKIFLL